MKVKISLGILIMMASMCCAYSDALASTTQDDTVIIIVPPQCTDYETVSECEVNGCIWISGDCNQIVTTTTTTTEAPTTTLATPTTIPPVVVVQYSGPSSDYVGAPVRMVYDQGKAAWVPAQAPAQGVAPAPVPAEPNSGSMDIFATASNSLSGIWKWLTSLFN